MISALALFMVAAAGSFPAAVIDCYDGDTCRVEILERSSSLFGPDLTLTWRESARLCDINAPEITGATKASGEKSRAALMSWLQAAKVIEVRPPVKNGRALREKYGRLLVWLVADGVNLNDKLVDEGLAVRYLECK
jgi:endonuclease YncB( thermonuclease family)